MSDLDLLVALASTPLGVAIALPFLMLAVSGIHHMWVHRAPVTNNRRTRLSAVRRRV
jgi:ABC-type phosphate/phosphonate transport system permease subunit